MTLAEEYLIAFEGSEKLDENLVKMIVEAFNKNYKEICDFFNYGELRKVTYVVDPEYNGVAATYTEIPKVVMNPGYYQKFTKDADSLTHELVHVAQNYWHKPKNDDKPHKKWDELTEEEKAERKRNRELHMPGWLTEGLADYGRDRFGVFNEEAGWKLPSYKEGQNYTDAYRVTAAFLKWAEQNGTPNLCYDLNDRLKKGTYSTDTTWKELTGYTVDELWDRYAKANR
ncbi:MAG: basic secretory protein-like protein [Eubacteriales bacterium]